MEVIDAIWRRQSVRSFKPDPVPKEILHQIMQIALRAPSWTNIQPWEFAIVGGQALARLKRALAERATQPEPPQPDVPWPVLKDAYERRMREMGLKTLEIKNINREDKEKRQEWYLHGVRFYDAPAAIIPYIDRSLNAWSILDMGHIVMLILLTAQEFGLGTCIQAGPTRYPEVVRKELGIPDSKLILSSIAVGYPNWDDPINGLRSPRDSIDNFVRWHGWD